VISVVEKLGDDHPGCFRKVSTFNEFAEHLGVR